MKKYTNAWSNTTLNHFMIECFKIEEDGFCELGSPVREMAVQNYGKDTIIEINIVCMDVYREIAKRLNEIK